MSGRDAGPPRRGVMLVLSSPSGAGKTTISQRLLADDDRLWMSVSATTRPPRPGERDGLDYQFVSQAAFLEMVHDDALLEHARVFDHHYGTPRAAVERALEEGRDVLFDVDWQGAKALKSAMPEDVVTVFVLPPSRAELERRLRTRAQDTPEVMAARMAEFASESSHWNEFDFVVVNSDIEVAVAKVTAILQAERLRRKRQPGLQAFVANLLNS